MIIKNFEQKTPCNMDDTNDQEGILFKLKTLRESEDILKENENQSNEVSLQVFN